VSVADEIANFIELVGEWLRRAEGYENLYRLADAGMLGLSDRRAMLEASQLEREAVQEVIEHGNCLAEQLFAIGETDAALLVRKTTRAAGKEFGGWRHARGPRFVAIWPQIEDALCEVADRLRWAATPGKRGRRKTTYKMQQREAAIAQRWQQAKSAGLQRVDFAKQEGLTLKELERVLDRVRKRRSPLE